MTIQPWQAAITRWGDSVFRLALLLNDTSAAAESATVQTFTRTLTAEQTDLETALYSDLLRQPGPTHWQRATRLLQGRSATPLPRALRRIPPRDRALLGLWLLRDVSGARLVTISALSTTAVIERLAEALLQLLPASTLTLSDSDAADQPNAAAFRAWLRYKLGLDTASPVHLASDAQHAAEAGWQTAVDELRLQLRTALDNQRLPLACSETIELNLLTYQSGGPPAWWERPAVWVVGVVSGALLALLLLILPDARPAARLSADRSAEPQTAQAIVQQALDGWSTQPISGTIQRTVWALPPALPPNVARSRRADDPQVTDVWIEAGSAHYRVEVHSGGQLLEWHLGDGTSRLEYAAEAGASVCAWGDTGALDSLARSFKASAEEQRAALTARLTQGSYGRGYHALRAALAADDLRSYGTRREGQDVLLALGYADRSGAAERRMLLWIDTTTKELRIVQELTDAGPSSAARDLWRLQQRQELPFGMPRARPATARRMTPVDRLFDPSCPALDERHVVSLRMLASNWWPRLYLPQQLPADVTRAALISSSIATADIYSPNQDVQAVFLGADHWLRISQFRGGRRDSADIERGPWRVNLNQGPDGLSAALCLREPADDGCRVMLDLDAQGWSQDELLEMIDTLTPADAQHWSELEPLFIDPAPLDPAVRATLLRAFDAIKPRDDDTLHTVAERSTRINPDRPQRADPYHTPLDEQNPARVTEEQTHVYQDGATLRSSELYRLPDGKLLHAYLNDGTDYHSYQREQGMALSVNGLSYGAWSSMPRTPAEEMLTALLENTLPISVTAQPDALTLQQATFESPYSSSLSELVNNKVWYDDLPAGSLLHRVQLDPATSMPRQLQLLHVARDGRETVLSSLTISEWRYLGQLAPAEAFQLPALPDDAVVFDQRQPETTRIVSGALTVEPPTRQLIWPAESGVELISDIDFRPESYSRPDRDGLIQNALMFSLAEIDLTGLMQSTHYRLPESDDRITILQGPRDLLRHILRHRPVAFNMASLYGQTSKQLDVTIAGQPQSIWLLDELPTPSLVVEVDQTLLYITGPNAITLEREIAPLLAQLTWVEAGSSK